MGSPPHRFRQAAGSAGGCQCPVAAGRAAAEGARVGRPNLLAGCGPGCTVPAQVQRHRRRMPMDGTVAGGSRPEIKLNIATKANSPLVPGRRKFFRYRDLGVSAATGGKLRAQVMEAVTGMTEP